MHASFRDESWLHKTEVTSNGTELSMKTAAEPRNANVHINSKTIAWTFIAFFAGLASGMALLQQSSSNYSGVQQEMLHLDSQHVWHNQNGWAEAAVVVINTGEKDVVLQKITVRGVECAWSSVYYWKTDAGPVSSELEQTSVELSGSAQSISIDGTQRSFHQATTSLALRSGWTTVLYIKHPGNITLDDVGLEVAIAIFTENKMYFEKARVEGQFTFMQTEQFNVVSATFNGNSGNSTNTVTLKIQNTGSSSFTIDTAAKVNGVSKTLAAQVTINAGTSSDVTIPSVGWSNGNQYNFELLTTQGTKITWIANAPGT